jgi:hypothetical protein
VSSSDNGRLEHWEVALNAFRDDRLRGSGAGTYQIRWAQDRPTTVDVRDGHSLYLETLGELGILGLVLLGACLLVVLGGFARRVRGEDRELFAALLAAAVAWALAAGVDWAWEMPAVTIWLFALGGAALGRPGRERAESDAPSTARRVPAVLIRGCAVGACVALAVLPARVAVSQGHLEESIARMHAGDCAGARAEARRSLDALDKRASPHHVIAWCDLHAGRPESAVAASARALRNDPDSWALLQTAAVARAWAGLDARAAATRAASQNPQNELTRATFLAVTRGTPRARTRAARRMTVTLPELGDP